MSSNGIYVWDAKYGIPKTYEEAIKISYPLGGYKEAEPNPHMAAFGAKMAEYIREAWQFYEGDEGLEMCFNIASETARMLKAEYCFEQSPKQCQNSFAAAIVRAACENNLVVFHRDMDCVFLPDGTAFDGQDQAFHWQEFVEKYEQKWQQHIQELIAKRNKPQIPISDAQRDRLTSKIIKARLGKPYQALLKKYQLVPDEYLRLRTDFCNFHFFIYTDKDKFKKGVYKFDSFIYLNPKKEYKEQTMELIPTLTAHLSTEIKISFFGFYGLSDKAHPNLEVDRHERSIRGSWKISEYDEWVKLVEAAADMLMYYLPHIGSLEDLVKLMQAHDAGETNFNKFTLPETNSALREFCVARDLKKLAASE